MSNKNNKLVEAKITLDSKEYEKSLANVRKKTETENKSIKKSSDNLTTNIKNNVKKIQLSNDNLAKNYGTLRASTNSDMEKIRNATVKMKTEAENSNNGIKISNDNLSKNYKTLRASTEADMEKIKSSLVKMKSSSEDMASKVKSSNDKTAGSFKNVNTEANNTKGVFSTMSSAIGSAINTASSKVKSSVDTMKGKLKELVTNTKEAQQKFEEFGKTAEKVADKVSGAGEKLTNGLTKPVVATGTLASGLAVNFEYAFAKVSTLLDLNEKELADYEAKLQKTAVDMNTNINEFAEAVYQAISAGVDYSEAIDFVGNAVKLSKGGFMDTASAVSALTVVMNTYGEKAGNLTEIQDKLISVQNNGVTTVGELSTALADVIPSASSVNLEFNELLGVFTHLTKKGLNASKASTRLKAMLDELAKSGTKASDALKEKTGKSFQELIESGKSLDEILVIVNDSAKEAGLSIVDMFGSSEASGAANAIIGNLEGFRDSVDAVANSAGSAEKAYAEMADTMKEKIAGAMVSMQSSLADLGQKMEPLLDALIEFSKKIPELLNGIDFEAVVKPFLDAGIDMIKMLEDIIKWFQGLDKNTQNFIAKAILMGASLGPVLSIFGNMISTIAMLSFTTSNFIGFFETGFGKGIISVLGKVGGMFSSLFGLVKTGFGLMVKAVIPFVMAHLPLVLVITAIIAVIALLIKNWDKVKEVAVNVCEVVKEKWGQFTEWFSGIWDNMVNVVKGAFDYICQWIKVGFQVIGDLIGLAFDIITLPWQFIWQNFGDVIIEAFDNICAWVQEGLNKIVEFFAPFVEAVTNAWNTMCDAIKNAWESASSWIIEKWNAFSEKAQEVFNFIGDKITETWSKMTNYLSEKWNSFTSWWSDTTNKVTENVSNAFNWVSDKIKEAFTKAIEFTSNKFEKLFNDIKGIIDKIKNAVQNVVKYLKDAFNFNWNLPKFKLPYINIEGSFSLNPPSAPSFNVDWRHNGAIFTRPTVLANGQGVGDRFKGMGAQKEAVLPIEKLPDLLGLNNRQGGDFNLNIENFNNEREQDIEQLVKEIGYFARKRGLNFGI